MKNPLLIVILFLLVGCHTPSFIIRPDYAYGGQFAIAKKLNDLHQNLNDGDLPLIGHHAALLVGVKAKVDSTPFDLETVIGPSIFVPEHTTNKDFISIEVGWRALIRGLGISPFIEARVGAGYTVGEKWIGEGTRHMYSVTGTIGLSTKITDHFRLETGYRFHHLSNGSLLFGSPQPNYGYNSDMIVVGLSYDF